MSGRRATSAVKCGITSCLALVALLVSATACGQPSSLASRGTPTPTTALLLSWPTNTPFPTRTPHYVWIPLASHSDTAILAAVRQSPFFQMVSASPPGTEGSWDVSHLGAPVYVAAYRAHAPQPTYDYYIVPGYDAAGQISDVIPAMLNQAHTAIYIGGISGYGPAPHFPSDLVSASQAVGIVER